MKVLFCGASVTAQDVNRVTNEISGYFPFLQSLLPRNIQIVRLAYGSQQFSCMGIFSLSKIIENNPDFVFLEWMTTGEKKVDSSQIISTTTMLRKHGIGVIWLLLPRLDFQDYTLKYDTLISLGSKITILSLLEHIESDDLSLYLRDLVHTNSNGALHYAQIIQKNFDRVVGEELQRLEEVSRYFPVDQPFVHLSSEEQELLYNEIDASYELMVGSTLEIMVSNSKKIGFWCETNPVSPILMVKVNQQPCKTVTIVDRWSFYARKILKPTISLDINSSISIRVHDQLPDYASVCPKLLTPEYNASIPKSSTNLTWKLESIFIQRTASIRHSLVF